MSGKSNFNSYDNDNRKYTSEVKQNVWKRSYSTHDFYAAALSGNILADVVKNGTICGVRLQEGEVDDMNGYRTIKITAGMTQEFEIIWTNAPDHVIKAQLMYIAACEEEGKQVLENPYGMIEEFGYVVNVIGSQDSLTTEDLEDAIIDAEFDYYDLQEGELNL